MTQDRGAPEIAAREGSQAIWENRGELDIIDSILVACEEKALKTHVMYRCKLNSKQIGIYLNYLLARQLIEKSHMESRDVYQITSKGKKFLRAYGELLEIVPKSRIED
jgi:predicted transcriptional regulator